MLHKSLIQFSVYGRALFTPYCLAGNQTMVELRKIMVTALKSPAYALLHSISLTLQQATINPHLCWRLLDTHSQTSLGQSLVGSLLLSPGSYMHKILFVPSNSFCFSSPWKFCNQIPLASKVKFPRGSQSLCQIPRLGNLLWVLEIALSI